MFKFIRILLFLLNFSIISEGFKGDTLVLTPSGYTQISLLNVNDLVLSYNFESAQINPRKILHTSSHFETQYRKIIFSNHETLQLSLDQRLLVQGYGWLESSSLVQKIQINQNKNSEILSSRYITESIELYEISVEEDHNFFVTQNNILAHNMVVVLPLIVETPVIVDAAISVGCVLGSYILSKWLSADTNIKEKAPGKPTENDGYKPPKNWDGQKKPHPKTGQYGYLDNVGNVWVPTGEKGYGGPHWDVVDKKGESYDNVYPGGHTRKGK
jgi:hypothetical protein